MIKISMQAKESTNRLVVNIPKSLKVGSEFKYELVDYVIEVSNNYDTKSTRKIQEKIF